MNGMFTRLRKGDWPSSPPYLLLLSKFRNCHSIVKYRDDVKWEAVLGGNPQFVIEQFIEEGLLEHPSLPDFLNIKFKIPELKAMLKNKGLKLSGNKNELICRLVDNDSVSMLEFAKGSDIYRCTATGSKLVEKYLTEENEKQEVAEKKTYEFLKQQEFIEAIRVMVQYESLQVFPRGLGIDWNTYESTSLFAGMVDALKAIFKSTPAILQAKDFEESQLKQIRLAAGMMRIWGARTAQRWMPQGVDKTTLDAWDIASRMLDFHAYSLGMIQSFKEVGVRNVEVSGIADDRQCPECKKIDGKRFKLEDAPELPYVKCTCEMGCRCLLIPEDKFWKNS